MISYLNKKKTSFTSNLSILDSLDERSLFKERSQGELKLKTRNQVEFCVFENVSPESKAYAQVAFLVAEDLQSDLQFYVRDDDDGDSEYEKRKNLMAVAIEDLRCVNKYYNTEIFRFSTQGNDKAFTYRNVMRFLILEYMMQRSLQHLNQDIIN